LRHTQSNQKEHLTVSSDKLTAAQAAAHLHVSEKTLQRLRSTNKGPAHSSTPSGRTVYTRTDLDAWRRTQFIATIIYAPIEVCERLPVAA
jgi:hypothetical protein